MVDEQPPYFDVPLRRKRHWLTTSSMALALGIPRLWAARPAFLKSIDEARKTAVSLTLLLGIALLGVVTWKATFERLIVVEPISIPKSLEGDGYTTTIIAQRLIDQVLAIQSARSVKARARISSESQFAAFATVQVPAAGFTLRSLIVGLREMLGVEDTKVGGEIVLERGNGLAGYSFTVRIDGPGGRYIQSIPNQTNVDGLVKSAANVIVEKVDPYIFAVFLYETEQWVNANEVAERVAMISDKDTAKWALSILGNLELRVGKNEEAISYFAQSVQLDPLFQLGHLNWGNVLRLQRKHEAALEKVQTVLAIDEKFCSAYVLWGNVLRDKENYKHAIDKYRHASECDPTDDLPLLEWGETLSIQKDHTGAILKVRHAVELRPNRPGNYNSLGIVYERQGSLDKALEMYRKSTEVGPRHAFGYFNSARLLVSRGEYLAAVYGFRKAMELGLNQPDVRLGLARSLAHIHAYDEAAFYYRQLNNEDEFVRALVPSRERVNEP